MRPWWRGTGSAARTRPSARAAGRARAAARARAVARGLPSSREAGFSLVEMLVSLTVTGFLGVAVVGLLLGQSRFYGGLDDALYADQGARAATGYVAEELRAAAPEDLLAATPESVSIRFDSIRAVVCERPETDEAHVYVYHRVGSPRLAPGTVGTFYRPTHRVDSATIGAPSPEGIGGPAGTACEDAGAPSGGPADDYLHLSWSGADAPPPGAMVRIFGRVTYRFAPSDFTSGRALWRNDAELFAPFDEEASFLYRLADGSESASPGSLADVQSVVLDATALGEPDDRTEIEREIRYEIALRNTNEGTYGVVSGGGGGGGGGDEDDGDGGDGAGDDGDGGDEDEECFPPGQCGGQGGGPPGGGPPGGGPPGGGPPGGGP